MAEDQPKTDPTLRVLTTAGNEPEASLICQRLAEEGIPASQQRSIGGPEWGLSGTRYVYVREADLERARDLLGIGPAGRTDPET
jgi:hypothetical protein